jgi:hypothetical protein
MSSFSARYDDECFFSDAERKPDLREQPAGATSPGLAGE